MGGPGFCSPVGGGAFQATVALSLEHNGDLESVQHVSKCMAEFRG